MARKKFSLEEFIGRIREGRSIQQKVRESGGNTFEQVVAATRGTGLCDGNYLVYAHQTLSTQGEVDEFLAGFENHISKNPREYPLDARKNPFKYAKRKFDEVGLFIPRRACVSERSYDEVLY